MPNTTLFRLSFDKELPHDSADVVTFLSSKNWISELAVGALKCRIVPNNARTGLTERLKPETTDRGWLLDEGWSS